MSDVLHDSQAATSTCVQQISLKEQEDTTRATDEDTDSCEHVYHVLEQSRENDYEELDKYEKRRWNQEEEVRYTLESPAREGEGPEGGASINNIASDEQEFSDLISTDGN